MWPFTRKVDKNSIEYLRKIKETLEKQAKERDIVDKSIDVAREFGEFYNSSYECAKRFLYCDLEIQYKQDDVSSIAVILYRENQVFEGSYIYGGVFGYIHSITSYLPGEWEDILDLKFKEVKELEKKREIESIRKNFLGE